MAVTKSLTYTGQRHSSSKNVVGSPLRSAPSTNCKKSARPTDAYGVAGP